MRAVTAALVAGLAVLAVGCGDDIAPTASSVATSRTGPPCTGCRTLRVGTDARLDGTSIGVRRCADGECSVALAAADGTETRRTLGPGDTLGSWRVEAVSERGLVLRRP